MSVNEKATVADNVAAVRYLADEGFRRHNLAAADEIVSPTMNDHNPFPGVRPGPEGVKDLIEMFYSAFPDVTFFNEHIFGDGDLVADHWHMEGTHQGAFLGIPPTGRRVHVEGIEVFRMAGGQIVERWAQIDSMGLMRQLGVLPVPGDPPGH